MYSFLNKQPLDPAFISDIVLGDQDVQVTLRRLSQALAATDLTALTNPDSDLERTMAELFGDSNGGQSMAAVADRSPKEELTAYVEAMKSRASVRKIMGELKTAAPALVQVMLTERDAYMAAGIDSLNQYKIVTAVMGIAHQDGVEANLQQNGWKAVVLQCPVRTP
jgi:pheromone shutdown protein TraB